MSSPLSPPVPPLSPVPSLLHAAKIADAVGSATPAASERRRKSRLERPRELRSRGWTMTRPPFVFERRFKRLTQPLSDLQGTAAPLLTGIRRDGPSRLHPPCFAARGPAVRGSFAGPSLR